MQPRLIKLKEDSSNFTKQKEQTSNHCKVMGLDTIITYGSNTDEDNTTHLVYSLFSTPKNFFNIYGKITIAQITILSNKLYATGKESVEQHKDACIYTYIFGSLNIKLQKYVSQNTKSHLY